MQGCPVSGRGFTAALVAIDKDFFKNLVNWVRRPLGGRIWWKHSQRFQHKYLIKTEKMDFEGCHSSSCCHQKVAVSYLGVLQVLPGPLWFFSRFPSSLTVWRDGDSEVDTLISPRGVFAFCAQTGFAFSQDVHPFLLKYEQELFFYPPPDYQGHLPDVSKEIWLV